MTRALDIWWDGRHVGQLTQDQYGELGFAYAPAWLHSNSSVADAKISNGSRQVRPTRGRAVIA